VGTVLAVTSAASPGAMPERALAGAEEVARHEAALLARVGAGELHEPVGELYDRYANRLMGFGLRLLADRGAAEELVQETFVRVWRAAAGFDARRGTVRAWIFTVARHVAVDLHRRRARDRIAEAPPELGADDAAFEALIVELTVRDALDTLTPEHRAVLELAYLGDLSQAEIASRLDLPLGTVKSRTFNALREMRVALASRGIDA
jgi:RNA polymerase sigma-70 factor, ECF subfamily